MYPFIEAMRDTVRRERCPHAGAAAGGTGNLSALACTQPPGSPGPPYSRTSAPAQDVATAPPAGRDAAGAVEATAVPAQRAATTPGVATQPAQQELDAPQPTAMDEPLPRVDEPAADARMAAGSGQALRPQAHQVNAHVSRQEEVRLREAETQGTQGTQQTQGTQVQPARSGATQAAALASQAPGPAALASPASGSAEPTQWQAGAPVIHFPSSPPVEAALTDKQLDDDLETAQAALLATLAKQRVR